LAAPFPPSSQPLFGGFVELHSGATGDLLYTYLSSESHANFGFSVSGGQDVNNDGTPDMIVGANGTGGDQFTGSVFVETFQSFLHVDGYGLSAGAGGTIHYNLDFPASEAGQTYFLLGSMTGAGPLTIGGSCIPLTFDSLTTLMIVAPPAQFQGSIGVLDTLGDASVPLVVAPGSLTTLVGARFWFAGVSLGTTPFALRDVSISAQLGITP